MAEALVGGALLSGFINVVFDRLLSPEAVKLIKVKKLDPELVERLKTALYAAEALLIDAEYQQFNKEPVRKWLVSLKDAVYKADDSLDHVFTKDATQKKVRVSLPRILNFKDRRRVSKMVDKIEFVVRRIEDNLKHKDILGLKEVGRDNNYSSWRTPATSLVKGNIYGREDDQQAIMKIINDESDHQKLSVIPIVGMGGVGKTTLAQWLYNNEDLMKGFDLKAWVCVSEQFDIVEVTKTIIEGITNSTCKLKDLNLLQLDLKEKLSSRKFFIVLDDVWSNDSHCWNNFRTPFQHGAEGSTIVVTTRGEDVASVLQTCSPYFLDGLSEDYCWSVFAENACLTESNGSADLQEIGRRIVKKCKGLPLAAETLGCLLRTERDAKEWNKVLLSDIWRIPVENSKIIPALLISYYHLPTHLKGCFVYCSLFPKDHRFDKDELILLWMAEDLLPPPKGEETLEEVGNECFDNLASRSFFKQHNVLKRHRNWKIDDEYFFMHDLLHDLSMFLAGDFYCRLEDLGKAEKMSVQTRHLSYGSWSHPISKNLDSIDKVESLRTFLNVDFSYLRFSLVRTPLVILSKLKYLRVLSFRSFGRLDPLPDSIGKLIHLRYLDLSKTSIKMLPESLCRLCNLQTLKVRGCYSLTMLPRGMHNLLNLRHLDLRETFLQQMPKGMSKLKHLHVFGRFVIGRQKKSASIRELGDLSYFDGTLELTNLENLANCDEALLARLTNKTRANRLILQWSNGGDIVSNLQTGGDISDKLQPHYGLKELEINGYRGTRFPNWVEHSSYHNMTRVSLVSCRSCSMLPSLGQLPSLKSLEIKNLDKVENIGVEFFRNADDPSCSRASPFSSLEDLTFRRMPCWAMWRPFDSDNAFPKLKSLTIIDCPRLNGDLPNHLPALETLEIERCQQLVSPLPSAPAIQYILISEIHRVEVAHLQELPLSLRELSIGGCQQVESMLRLMSINHPTCLESIKISNCSSATSLSWDCLPGSLRKLRIQSCRKLEFPCQPQQKHKLVELELERSCDSLTLLQLEAFPDLKRLQIRRCENLESFSLPESESQSQHIAPNMYYFHVSECKKLKSLPCHMNTFLPNLKYLEIHDCPDIDSFPEGGLPPSLKELQVFNCEKLLSNLSSMGVLESLTHLEIVGHGCLSIKSFPNEGLLPGLPSLTTMCLIGFPNLEILECKELVLLTSLKNLKIHYCPKLEKIAGERLPHSLLQLRIYECPLLIERCEKKHNQIWPKISRIPRIKVNGRWLS